VFQRVWIFVSAEIKSSIVLDAAGALGTDAPIAKVAITATTADFINLDLNTDFPRIQIKEMGLYPISIREPMPKHTPSQLSLRQILHKFKALPK
jgi:hypothetical protein